MKALKCFENCIDVNKVRKNALLQHPKLGKNADSALMRIYMRHFKMKI